METSYFTDFFFQYPRCIVLPIIPRLIDDSVSLSTVPTKGLKNTSMCCQDELLSITFVFIYLFLDRFSLCSAGWSGASYAELASNLETPPASALKCFNQGCTTTSSLTVGLE